MHGGSKNPTCRPEQPTIHTQSQINEQEKTDIFPASVVLEVWTFIST
jgi:hypothetical protein